MTFGQNCTDACTASSSSKFIAGFCDDNISNVTLLYKQLSREDYDQRQFYEAQVNIMKHATQKYGCSVKKFDPEHIFVITWINAFRSEKSVSYSIMYKK